MNKILLIFISISFVGNISAVEKVTIEDRLINIEKDIAVLKEGQKALNQRIDDMNANLGKRIDDTNKRIDDLHDLMLWGFGILFVMMIALFGYIVWDRRTASSPVVKKTAELEKMHSLILNALKKYAQKEPKLAEAMKSFGLL